MTMRLITAFAALLLCVVLPGPARAGAPSVAVVDAKDPWTGEANLAKALRKAGARVTDVSRSIRGGSFRPARVSALIVGSFATSSPAVRRGLSASASDIARFVEAGGLLIYLGQEARDCPELPGLPPTMLAALGERDARLVSFREPTHPLLSAPKPLTAAALGALAFRSGGGDKSCQLEGAHDTFRELRGLRPVVWSADGVALPVLAEGSFGKGRVIVSAWPLDEYAVSPANDEVARTAVSLLGNLLARAGSPVPPADADPAPWRAPVSEATVSVFDDRNGNGVRDPGEPGLAGVRVGHGLDRHLTNEAGELRLRVDTAFPRWVHVQSPSGWHFPGGLFAQDSVCSTLSFPATRQTDSADGFSFLHVTDIHVGSRRHSSELFEQAVADWARMQPKPAFVLVTGDMTQSGSREEVGRYQEVVGRSPLPVYPAQGNHDAGRGPDRGRFYEEEVGPVFYGFDHAGVHFTVAYVSEAGSPEREWTKRDIQESGLPTVLVLHHLPRAGLLRDLSGLPIVGVLHGHWHGNRVSWFDEYPVVATSTALFAGWDHSPASFRVVDVRDGKITGAEVRYTAARHMAHIVVPADGSDDGGTQIIVHALDSARPAETVSARLADSEGRDQGLVTLRRVGPTSWAGDMPHVAPGEYILKAELADRRGVFVTALSSFGVRSHPPRPTAGGGDWPTYRGDTRRTGDARARLRAPLSLRWAKPLPGTCHHAAPVADGDTLYVALEDRDGIGGPGRPGLYALDRETGRLRWRWESSSSVRHSPSLHSAMGLVILQEETGLVTALRTDDGTVAWQYDLAATKRPAFAAHWASCAPLVEGGQVVTCYHVHPTVLSARDGRPIATLARQGREDAFTLTSVASGGDVLVHGGLSSGLAAYTRGTGGAYEEIWRKRSLKLSATPTFSRHGLILQGLAEIEIIDPDTGTTRKRLAVRGPWSPHPPTVVGESLLAADRAGALVSMDLRSGKRLWRQPTGPAPLCQAADSPAGDPNLSGSPVIVGGTIFYGADDGVLRAASAQTGHTLWQRNLGLPVTGGPIAVGSDLYVVDFGGVVQAFTSAR